mgnify:CR=1 FL=1
MEYVLKLWLKNPPDYAVLFTRIVLVDCLIDCLNYQIMTLVQATGKIKLYQSVVGGILLLNFPVSFFILKFGAPAYYVLLISVILTIVAMAARLFIIKRLTKFSIFKYLGKVVVPCLVVSGLSFILPFIVKLKIIESFGRLCLITFISCCMIIVFTFYIGLTKNERDGIKRFIRKKLKKDNTNSCKVTNG